MHDDFMISFKFKKQITITDWLDIISNLNLTNLAGNNSFII